MLAVIKPISWFTNDYQNPTTAQCIFIQSLMRHNLGCFLSFHALNMILSHKTPLREAGQSPTLWELHHSSAETRHHIGEQVLPDWVGRQPCQDGQEAESGRLGLGWGAPTNRGGRQFTTESRPGQLIQVLTADKEGICQLFLLYLLVV